MYEMDIDNFANSPAHHAQQALKGEPIAIRASGNLIAVVGIDHEAGNMAFDDEQDDLPEEASLLRSEHLVGSDIWLR